MSSSHIRLNREDAVLSVVIDRPEVRNAYTSRTCFELVAAIEEGRADDSIRVLVLSGAGGSFCTGGDVSSPIEIDAAHERQFGHGVVMREGMQRVIRALHDCDKPVIAKIDGPAVSGGLALALACDFRVGSERARLGDRSGSVGLLPDEGGAWLFQRVLGRDRAVRMSLLHELYDAAESLRLGLLTDLATDLDAEVQSLALTLAAKAPLAARMTKQLMRRAEVSNLDNALKDAELAVQIVNDSHDVTEGVAAFLERRPPVFIGR
jgi:2-(1,2-epoxy-1,2-dihydrophenyl)acetyl-CoA isomerase